MWSETRAVQAGSNNDFSGLPAPFCRARIIGIMVMLDRNLQAHRARSAGMVVSGSLDQ